MKTALRHHQSYTETSKQNFLWKPPLHLLKPAGDIQNCTPMDPLNRKHRNTRASNLIFLSFQDFLAYLQRSALLRFHHSSHNLRALPLPLRATSQSSEPPLMRMYVGSEYVEVSPVFTTEQEPRASCNGRNTSFLRKQIAQLVCCELQG